MSGATGATGATQAAGEAGAFAALLRGLKDRSQLSYGALAKRLHMSTSTLHRYCNGSVVPTDYAPVERLARVCRATPEELVALHRSWILADGTRGRKAPEPEGGLPEAAGATEPASAGGGLRAPEAGEEPVVGGPGTGAPEPPRRRRAALIASAATAALLGAVLLAVNLPSSGGDGGDRKAAPGTGTGTSTGRAVDASPSASTSPSPSKSARTGTPPASAPASSAAPGSGGAAGHTGGVPVNVGIRPYVYDDPCSQHFLVDSEPAQVGPPATEQEAPRWAAAYGAVSSDEQRVALTVQGTGKETVVLEALHVRVVTKDAPLAWNDYSMGVGCGGGVETESFDVDLDDGSPTVAVKNGQRAFPYKVSESDPEVFYVTAHTKAHDVRWDLSLSWSSGARHGTVHIDDDGTPFRTSAAAGRPGYDYPIGTSEWVSRDA
ncbi:helix-turn-helix domain-containing protein [Streptomyces odontomachi]|uniref:helix-turn-helix domain-containing protein n=1 Tax=Streptomyces odontomachi TaxID=2944940 RepID=UPI00210EC432|nr:helix-turn-helix transcriptional regulator [Streptomyces sp. ODS25]